MKPRSARLAVLTSGGDAQAMNAAIRAVVRTALHLGVEVFGVHEGYDGLAGATERIEQLGWDDVSRVLDRGGTMLGTARSTAFRERAGRRLAAIRLVRKGIDRIVVIGGDGSLTGALLLHDEWSQLLAEAVAAGELSAAEAERHGGVVIVGVPGSIDNDLPGTDVAVGTDSALRQIVDAIDALEATATSHQRTFVVEVMGRNCGYLAAAGAIAGGADYVLLPETPVGPDWQHEMCTLLGAGRAAGRRNSVVVVAEGARNAAGAPITAGEVRAAIERLLGDETRVTVPGHVQRGGVPSAADRVVASLMGAAAARAAVDADLTADAHLVGIRGTRPELSLLRDALARAGQIAQCAQHGDGAGVRALRGAAFGDLVRTSDAMARAVPRSPQEDARRVGVLVEGPLAPGMNAVVRALVRLGLSEGLEFAQIDDGLAGLVTGQVRRLDWDSVCGWAGEAGSRVISGDARPVDLSDVGAALEKHRLDALVVLGGWSAYEQATRLAALEVPTVVIPASIGGDVPGTETCVGADSAVNWIVSNADRIRHLGTSQVRCIVVETGGDACGYLPTVAGLAGGAVRVYVPEEPVDAAIIREDAQRLARSVDQGQRLGLVIRGERAAGALTTDELCRAFEEFGDGRFTMHQVVPGQTQFGGSPSPADRLLAARVARCAVTWLASADGTCPAHVVTTVREGLVSPEPLASVATGADSMRRRRTDTWWSELAVLSEALSNRPGTSARLMREFASSPGSFARPALVVPTG